MEYQVIQDGDKWTLQLFGFDSPEEVEKYYDYQIKEKSIHLVEQRIPKVFGERWVRLKF